MKKILIVEDEPSIAELQKDYLELSGFDVDLIDSGKKGLDQALHETYDLLILDVMLPEINGFEICKRVREEKDIPILMVSAKKEDIDKIRGLGLGADDYISKPFSPSELVARVKAHLTRYERLSAKSTQTNKQIQIRGIQIDQASRRVYVNKHEVVMTMKEFDLLLFFARNPNQVFSRDHLFERIWGFDSMGDPVTVTVHIRKLREKIEQDPSNPQYIETVWGAGYRFTV
ncbi:DNA-binding response regulator, OmpR family, contains REC and winged-helix (wHTH) domain [Seinonella peptonophila]|uniref:DNA-binding response regulator, OmpR family, contains REC and winged-helix (WHTH) domain n=1 Tax=Seinonella peptonophila TaxID=112248 RepID=A0A1M4ZMP9_9BACL|nr:response regulator transcription factor [Seinonella peptonophila]SHF19288.1 DNA-binding response regulator, OmpR family, contains REC and winged-helix (wHTH) domain [Seinonella peptonophila]